MNEGLIHGLKELVMVLIDEGDKYLQKQNTQNSLDSRRKDFVWVSQQEREYIQSVVSSVESTKVIPWGLFIRDPVKIYHFLQEWNCLDLIPDHYITAELRETYSEFKYFRLDGITDLNEQS